ncbi:hypothetical protein [Acetivibrio cellulolyticus]|uniref:hypothetical protein n=1 Tax=Acetivibrio cellulolyticus TaxID=35830 RepID=UPI0001E2F0D8|nr:hypothetical protein [Acetivibrio cellulolyticus]
MINIQRVLIVFISSLIIVIFTSCSKNEITVSSSNSEIKDGIESFINKGNTRGIKIELKNKRNIDNVKIVSFCASNQKYGYAVLEKRSQDVYLIRSACFLTDVLNTAIIKTTTGKYHLAVSSNCNIDFKTIRPKPYNKSHLFEGLRP